MKFCDTKTMFGLYISYRHKANTGRISSNSVESNSAVGISYILQSRTIPIKKKKKWVLETYRKSYVFFLIYWTLCNGEAGYVFGNSCLTFVSTNFVTIISFHFGKVQCSGLKLGTCSIPFHSNTVLLYCQRGKVQTHWKAYRISSNSFLKFGCLTVKEYCIALKCSKPVPS